MNVLWAVLITVGATAVAVTLPLPIRRRGAGGRVQAVVPGAVILVGTVSWPATFTLTVAI